MPPELLHAIATVSPGPWAVGVSGGADSVALLLLLRTRLDLSLHIVHLDHQTRRDQSTADAIFVQELCQRLGLPHTIAVRSEVEATMGPLPANPSARYRAVRLELFRRIVEQHRLHGVILAHHADDQAETILHRLLRGAGATALGGIQPSVQIRGLNILHPLLGVRRQLLRDYLVEQNQPWREDASNASAQYLRNRLRTILLGREDLFAALLDLGHTSSALDDWVESAAPRLEDSFDVRRLHGCPRLLARRAARNWLLHHHAPPADLSETVLDRLLTMANDAASPARQHFPGELLLRRHAGKIEATRNLSPAPKRAQ